MPHFGMRNRLLVTKNWKLLCKYIWQRAIFISLDPKLTTQKKVQTYYEVYSALGIDPIMKQILSLLTKPPLLTSSDPLSYILATFIPEARPQNGSLT